MTLAPRCMPRIVASIATRPMPWIKDGDEDEII